MQSPKDAKRLALLHAEHGTEVVEWAIVAGLLMIVAVAAWPFLGDAVQSNIADILAAISST